MAEWRGNIDDAAKCPDIICNSDCCMMPMGTYSCMMDTAYVAAARAAMLRWVYHSQRLAYVNMFTAGPRRWHHRPAPPTSAEVAQRLAPIYMYTVEKFGVDRCMFASNFPMGKASGSYTVLWNSYKRMTEHMPLADRRKLFHDNAECREVLPA
jgi:predicted TIM-barrel fold metal-dependent hydrolase